MMVTSTRKITVGVVMLLAAGNVLLTVGVLYFGLRGRPTLVVPGVKEEFVSVPSQVPEGSIRNFAILYVLYFDDYSPVTAVDRANYLLRLVSADRIEAARHALEERATYVVRARESSQLSPPLPEQIEVHRLENGQYRVVMTALRRTLIADALKEVLEVRYVLDVALVVPSETNAFGLVVTSQAIETRAASGSEERKDGR